ncbi:hypothetical protein DM860_010042 [Cuscuta australis]|uniref:HAT C-terminal dimerisation domain-containing protein n=1 Tax=Cuscuta australis TaxID=267555 RepID=A0A328D9X9_9ASTE|nr:hypothetical protein DM860_010042 [Cuscuta australis]
MSSLVIRACNRLGHGTSAVPSPSPVPAVPSTVTVTGDDLPVPETGTGTASTGTLSGSQFTSPAPPVPVPMPDRRSVDMGDVNRRLSKGKAKATSDGSISRGCGSRGRHSVSSFPTVLDHLIGDAMTDEEFNQIYSGRGDANLPTLDSLFEDVDEAGLDNLDGDDEPTPQSNDVDVEAGEPETSRGPDKGIYQGLYGIVQEETAPPPPPKSKKGFAGIVGGLLAKKGKRAQSSTSSSGTTVSSHNELAMYQGVPCDYDDKDVDFDVLGWWKRNEHMFLCLGMLARQVLSVPVSTVAVEREFSAGGNILTDY